MIDTTRVTLDLPLHPIRILPLSDTGMMPDAVNGSASIDEHRPYESPYAPQRNRVESQLLSVWINTHQAMFMTIAMSAYSVLRAIEAIHRRDLPATLDWLNFACQARLASAAYTDLPALTQPRYEGYLRETMKRVHAGFSGVSNLESIKMELALRQLKHAVLAFQATDREFALAIHGAHQEVARADQFWWHSHGQAMRRMVRSPISLAQMDARRKAEENGNSINFDEYREMVLHKPKALTEYDLYFAVERRSDLSLDQWQRNLTRALATADDYIAQDGPVVEQSRPARPHLFELIKRAAA